MIIIYVIKGIFFCLLLYLSYSQHIIISSEDGLPVRYVLVRVNTSITVSDSLGYFNLDFGDSDSVYFGHVAYYDTVIIGRVLKKVDTIIMCPRDFMTDAVLITSENTNIVTIVNDECNWLSGNAFSGRCCEWQYFPNPLGKEANIKSLLFKVSGGNSKCILRVNLYEVINGDSFDIDKPLLPEDVEYHLKGLTVFMPIGKKIEMNVSDYNITLPTEGIFVKVCGICNEGGEFYFGETAIENKIPMYISCDESKISKYNLLPVKNLCCKGFNDVCYIVKAIRMKVTSP